MPQVVSCDVAMSSTYAQYDDLSLCLLVLVFVVTVRLPVGPGSGSVPCYVSVSHCYESLIIILVPPPGVVCSSNSALPMPGTSDGDAVSHCQVMGRAGSVHHGADQ